MPVARSLAFAALAFVSAACGQPAPTPSPKPTGATEAVAALRTTPMELRIQRPTLLCLGITWGIAGDDNRNATVAVQFRGRGEEAWKDAMPLLRIKDETAFKSEDKDRWSAPNMFAGSILDLKPDTEYEVRLTLTDPDGLDGDPRPAGNSIERTLMGRTRSEPMAFDGGRRLHVYPDGHAGRTETPSFAGLRPAMAEAQAGDVVLIHAGAYAVHEAQKKDRTDYIFEKSGTPEKPIVFRAAGDGEVVLDGKGALKLIDCQKASHLFFEGLTFRGADHFIYAGRGDGCAGLTVKRCRFLDRGFGIFALNPKCRDFYIADCEFLGPCKEWHPRDGKKPGANTHAIWLMGQGHVVCYNRFDQWWDGIDFAGGSPGPDPALWNGASDWYGNDISRCMDDGVECDYSVHNLRVFRNRFWNCFMAISFQPVYAGPCYAFRNVVFNVTRSPIKPNCDPAGLMVFNNTFVCHGSAGRWAPMWQNTRIMNNLFLGTEGGPGVIWTGTPTPETSVLDYNGWHFFASSEKHPIWWKFPVPRKVWTGSNLSTECVYRDLKHFVGETGFEQHGVPVTPDVFVKYAAPSGQETPLPEMDLRLKEGSAAVDAGAVIPQITDGFAGKAPDLGAYELGTEPPHYGPRPTK